ncbi:nucleotide sugar dehydrogenase [Brevibacillus sp. B_LB10_24]|uniref:nucleotide sugar dehydrogenase n=1 Tax=Brevibacillus sp. B_LB10_24 TaxID=3380645 RepID=UPI0038BACE34
MGSTSVNVAVVGLGFVGLPLAVHMARRNCIVLGIDMDSDKIEKLHLGHSYIPDVPSDRVKEVVQAKRFSAGLPSGQVGKADYVIVAVPTPMDEQNKKPDLEALVSAAQYIARHLRRGQTVVFESSTYPGTLEEVILPILATSGLQAGKDFFLGYSPERIDPGNRQFGIRQIPKVISGLTPACCKKVKELYVTLFDTVVPVSSPKVAEMCKLFENIYRFINISLVNEMLIMCRKMNISFRETLQAAATKPFGFTPFKPGPGIGGHCIPVDPLYFQWRAAQFGLSSRMIEAAKTVNEQMPKEIVSLVTELLKRKDGPNSQPSVLLLGVAYKKDVSDLRESPAFDIFALLQEAGIQVAYHDPLIPEMELAGQKYTSIPLTAERLRAADLVVVITDHSSFPWDFIGRHSRFILDTRGIYPESHEKVVRWA